MLRDQVESPEIITNEPESSEQVLKSGDVGDIIDIIDDIDELDELENLHEQLNDKEEQLDRIVEAFYESCDDDQDGFI
eukprot:UN06166